MTWDEFRHVLPKSAAIAGNGHLTIAGCDVWDLASEFGTPLYVMDESEFRRRLGEYRDAFGADNVHYAAKAFLSASLAPIVASEGVGMDCASGGELYTAMAGGFDASRIVMHGNNKSDAELEMAVDAGVSRIVLDSVDELERLERIAAHREVGVAALLRVTPGIEAHTHEYLQTGIEDTKFGVPIGEVAARACAIAARAPHVELEGIHAHIGSQIFDVEPFRQTVRVLIGFMAEVRDATGLEMTELDIGGGAGIAYLPSDDPQAIEAIASAVKQTLAEEAWRLSMPTPDLKVEPGRSVVGPSMITIYTTGAAKEIVGVRTYLPVDGGMSDNIRPALYQAEYTFLAAERPEAVHDTEYAIAGKLCESGDILTKSTMLPTMRPGELLAVAATGAYGYSMASNYNKTPRPPVICVNGGQARVLVRRETFEDLVRMER